MPEGDVRMVDRTMWEWRDGRVYRPANAFDKKKRWQLPSLQLNDNPDLSINFGPSGYEGFAG